MYHRAPGGHENIRLRPLSEEGLDRSVAAAVLENPRPALLRARPHCAGPPPVWFPPSIFFLFQKRPKIRGIVPEQIRMFARPWCKSTNRLDIFEIPGGCRRTQSAGIVDLNFP